MSAIDAKPFPRAALIGAGALIAATLAMTAAVRVARWDEGPPGMNASTAAPQTASAEASIRFLPEADGRMRVEDLAGRTLTVLPADGSGFVRGVLRATERERMQKGVPAEAPYRLLAWANGRLALEDPSSGRRIDVSAFGADNREGFATLLAAAETAP